jgi:hypothetical protein
MGIEMRASLLAREDGSLAIKGRFMRARLLPERLAAGIQFAENFSELRRPSFRARTPIIAARWIPGLRPSGRIPE